MKMITIICLMNLMFCSQVIGMYSSKAMEGYPAGYLPDCPGSNKKAIITRKSLKYLTLTVHGPGNTFIARRAKYSYYQTKELARDPDVDFSRRTILYIGGWLDSASFPFARFLGQEYRNLGYNAWLVDANKFVTVPYPLAVRYMRPVGLHLAEMLANLTKLGLDPKKLEIIGLSLGAHTMSYIAKNYRLLTGMNISRLTGLDPAGPCFRNLGPEDRLDISDADFVDTINTNIDGYGMAAPLGHVNFYINGGEFQPGDIFWNYCNLFCSHIRSYALWMAALTHPDSFIAMQCDTVQQARDKKCFNRKPSVNNVVGLKTNRSVTGIFYLVTQNDYPYYLGEKGLHSDNEFFDSRIKSLNEKNVIKI